MNIIEKVLGEAAPDTDSCAVDTCDDGDVAVTPLKPLDPIDHEETYVALCGDHLMWAEERNEFSEAVADELRKKRREIGQRELETVESLRNPPDGEIDDGLSMSAMAEARDLMGSMVGGVDDE